MKKKMLAGDYICLIINWLVVAAAESHELWVMLSQEGEYMLLSEGEGRKGTHCLCKTVS